MVSRNRYKCRNGDHSTCSAENCQIVALDQLEGNKNSEGAVSVGTYYNFRGPGRRFWRQMTKHQAYPPDAQILLVEACRIVDRLHLLNESIRDGRPLVRVKAKTDEETEYVMYCDRALAEGREQAMALKGIIGEIRMIMAKTGDGKPAMGSGMNELANRIAERWGGESSA